MHTKQRLISYFSLFLITAAALLFLNQASALDLELTKDLKIVQSRVSADFSSGKLNKDDLTFISRIIAEHMRSSYHNKTPSDSTNAQTTTQILQSLEPFIKDCPSLAQDVVLTNEYFAEMVDAITHGKTTFTITNNEHKEVIENYLKAIDKTSRSTAGTVPIYFGGIAASIAAVSVAPVLGVASIITLPVVYVSSEKKNKALSEELKLRASFALSDMLSDAFTKSLTACIDSKKKPSHTPESKGDAH